MDNQNVIRTSTQFRAHNTGIVNVARHLPGQPANYPMHGRTNLTHTTAPFMQSLNMIVTHDAPELTKKSNMLSTM